MAAPHPQTALRLLILGLSLPQWTQAGPPQPPQLVTFAVSGLTQGYLEPCGCGGQDAGGLARRAQLVADLRREHHDLVCLDIGGFGQQTDRLPVIARALAAMGVDAVGLGSEDLVAGPALLPRLAAAALPVTSLVPPL